jgi:two-component system cell cycle response regulator
MFKFSVILPKVLTMNNQKILIIEDNPTNLKLIRSLLGIGKYEVIEAMDADTGIQYAQQHRPDLILMDVQLPGMDGLSATRKLKKEPALKDIPVVAITAHAMQGDDKKALEAGCAGYISKPLDTRKFLERIAQFLLKDNCTEKTFERDIPGYRKRVLIVDDEPVNIKVLTAKLASDEYEVIPAYSGKEALEKAADTPPEVILLDIMMPEMDGYEVTRRLKEDPKTSHIPVIILTALNETKDKLKALDAGAEEFISKPVNSTELIARIKSMLLLRQYREQLDIRSQSEESFACPVSKGEPVLASTDSPLVLLVEDNERDVKLIQSYLHGQPYRVAVAASGEEGLLCVEREKVDLILLDIMLPGMDGFEVCRRLRKMEQARNVQIVVITSLNDLENKLTGIQLGVDDFLVKPLNARELTGRINILLDKKVYMDTLCYNCETALNSAIIDGLTGLYNNAYFKRFLDIEVKRSLRHGYPVSLVMIDVDDFKDHNDTLGHPAGDIILKECAQVIRENVREIDLPVRYGGDELAIVLPYCNRENALQVLERIRQALASHVFPDKVPLLPGSVTISMGLAMSTSDAASAEELTEKADRMLYRAKNEGKDRISC